MSANATPDTERQRHVLYVEDDRINIVLMEEVFRLMPGWTLHVAETGAQAMEMLPQVMPSLVLMDMNLPDMNGLQLIGLVRADARLAALPCVALSADVMDDQRQRARAAGFQDYWLKPIDVRRLREQLERF